MMKDVMGTSDYKNKYVEYVELVERRLFEISEKVKPKKLNDAFRYVIGGGGKRLRPILTMICCGAVGGDAKAAVDAGVAIEIMHNFTLVHDDIMDSSSKRRGREAVHIKWDESTGILIGDLMIGHAYNLLPSLDGHERAQNILNAFNSGLIEVCEGQGYDMEYNECQDISLDNYMAMINKKTAKLIETSAVIGAELGYGDIMDVEALGQYANSLGIGFQIQDDLLDLIGEEDDFGKKPGQDIIEGKKTYLILKAILKAEKSDDIELLEKFKREKGLSEKYIPVIKELMQRLGVFDDAQDEIDMYLNHSRTKLGIIKPGMHKEMLYWLIDSLNKRKQ